MVLRYHVVSLEPLYCQQRQKMKSSRQHFNIEQQDVVSFKWALKVTGCKKYLIHQEFQNGNSSQSGNSIAVSLFVQKRRLFHDMGPH